MTRRIVEDVLRNKMIDIEPRLNGPLGSVGCYEKGKVDRGFERESRILSCQSQLRMYIKDTYFKDLPTPYKHRDDPS